MSDNNSNERPDKEDAKKAKVEQATQDQEASNSNDNLMAALATSMPLATQDSTTNRSSSGLATFDFDAPTPVPAPTRGSCFGNAARPAEELANPPASNGSTAVSTNTSTLAAAPLPRKSVKWGAAQVGNSPPSSAPSNGVTWASSAAPILPLPFGAASTPAPAPASTTFGLPTAAPFGTTTNFGATPASSFFGSPAPTPAFGEPAPFPVSTFGTSSSSRPFGAPEAASGASTASSSFGASSVPFGAPPPPPPAFGASTSGSLFGASPAPSPFGVPAAAFGAPDSLFGASSAAAFGTSTTANSLFGASSAAPFGASTAQPSFGAPAPASGDTYGHAAAAHFGAAPIEPSVSANDFCFQSLTAMPAYQQKCPEELRLEDYAQGNCGVAASTPMTQGTSYGKSFGAAAPSYYSGQSGASTTPAPAAAGSPFGATSTNASHFGAPTHGPSGNGGGLFGSSAPAATFGAPSSGLFSASVPSTHGLFGSRAPAPTGGGLFSSPTPAPSSGDLFGSPAPDTAFGAPDRSSFSASAPSTYGWFGSATPAPISGGLFGSPAPAPFAASGSGLFGAPAPSSGVFLTSGFGVSPTTFGTPMPVHNVPLAKANLRIALGKYKQALAGANARGAEYGIHQPSLEETILELLGYGTFVPSSNGAFFSGYPARLHEALLARDIAKRNLAIATGHYKNMWTAAGTNEPSVEEAIQELLHH